MDKDHRERLIKAILAGEFDLMGKAIPKGKIYYAETFLDMLIFSSYSLEDQAKYHLMTSKALQTFYNEIEERKQAKT